MGMSTLSGRIVSMGAHWAGHKRAVGHDVARHFMTRFGLKGCLDDAERQLILGDAAGR